MSPSGGGRWLWHPPRAKRAQDVLRSPQVVLVEELSGTLPAVLAGLAAVEPSPEPVVVLNADTIVGVHLASCAEASPAWATVTAVLTELPTGQNEGTVLLAPTGRILAFAAADGTAGYEATPFKSFEPWSQSFPEAICCLWWERPTTAEHGWRSTRSSPT